MNIEKLKSLKLAVDNRVELHKKITSSGTPPHPDFWCQSISASDKQVFDIANELINDDTSKKDLYMQTI